MERAYRIRTYTIIESATGSLMTTPRRCATPETPRKWDAGTWLASRNGLIGGLVRIERAGRSNAPDRLADYPSRMGRSCLRARFESMPDSRLRNQPADFLLGER
jgi:hypothetical protein